MMNPLLTLFLVLYGVLSAAVALNTQPLDQHSISVEKRKHSICEDSSYRKHVLKLVKEAPFAGLFRDNKNQSRWEASGVAAIRGQFYVVFDSSMAIGKVDDSFSFRGKNNWLVGDPNGVESQFEGISYVPENDTFLLLRESAIVSSDTNKDKDIEPYNPVILTAKLNADSTDYQVQMECPVDFELTHENKGFESILYVRTLEEETYLLGLCEGNYCVGGSEGADPGNGRIVVSQLEFLADGCVWKPVKTISIPESAYFRDYSAMAYNHATGKIAILSQEDAAVWVGDFDLEKVDFQSENGEIFHLPRDNHCEMVYCNAEGVQWLDNYRLLIASDKAKSDQPFWCSNHDQSIEIFAFPADWDPYV